MTQLQKDYQKTLKTIDSCTTHNHLWGAENMGQLFINKYTSLKSKEFFIFVYSKAYLEARIEKRIINKRLELI